MVMVLPMMYVMAQVFYFPFIAEKCRETNPNNWRLLPFRDQSEKLVKFFAFSNILLIIMHNFISDTLIFFFNKWNKYCLETFLKPGMH